MNTNVIITAVTLAVAVAAATLDGRSNRCINEEIRTISSNIWPQVKHNPMMSWWYQTHLRCSRYVFLRIVERIDSAWRSVHGPLHHNVTFDVMDRVAPTIHYLTHSDGYDTSALVFGISKTRAHVYTKEVCQVLKTCFLQSTVQLPKTNTGWEEVSAEFEEVAGIPNIYGAIDGSLIPIKRFADFTGWYCRKGFTAFNMQAVVDARMRFRSYSLRSGSQNDKGMFNKSKFGKTCHTIVPPGGCFVADAGYQLFKHILTPYNIELYMPDDESHFNLLHSRTRIVVERAFGLWKNTFRIFKTELL